ncbi:PREDICTED: LEAF RUST 10 DISEASE-RESISTANCE LOCUS RECEPTOR-LIKE PROTEIN KINASE-like 2.1 isoform X2 [Tarenaya hassleriana]|uniref:LEAF RUST 10 DISEASE-RESISTANCE LOCUS RECEPTOR-LIKE PROTEIN KINASE-like 2.1 isoform X1 n=1 Tax=Tarenaya hassleriana TaxID=28532 RepID=UPI00053C2FB2|nr:PREDICTED: LEAF RUST 10 DISEASE-RESISTANCE LOCUS RECEPTOR-LIKE PROTEIN KINASE-like 2.1 isoform X1 [Tarenaya hassleriana]XP_010553909.1 PREDICTED: LEAF RUST 10 DISEASE-RESISTANCE LOCUS RECEPTOR-LIKE PROTEIN KINASE-like 2.1 isoform X2 [Tarenaya hassleriana]
MNLVNLLSFPRTLLHLHKPQKTKKSTMSSMYYVILLVIFVIPSCVLSLEERHRLCSEPFRCGNQAELSYPFWRKGREDCGHPDFEVDCDGDFAEFNTSSSVKLRILQVDFLESRTITLARTDYLNTLCPSNLVNVSLFNEIFLGYLPGTEVLTLYHDCRNFSSFSPAGYIGELPCEYDDGGKGYFVTRNISLPLLDGVRAMLNEFTRSCKSVDIPASGPALVALQESPTPQNLQKAFDEGSGLILNYATCEACRESGGACGYNRTTEAFVCYCMNESHDRTCDSGKKSGLPRIAEILIGIIISFAGTVVLLAMLAFCVKKRKALSAHRRSQKLKELIPLKQYSYAEVKRITKSFSHVVGRGGFGTVYGGNLPNGRKVAVKILKDSKGDGQEFINEVESMSKTSHVNIVSLLGFCYQGSKRAIISEFLENGSLDKLISGEAFPTDWRTLYEIALGVARGLEYLHYGCKTRIVHFDIKPQNVLLDKNLCPKVSDFGLAKLCENKESILSMLEARGTVGYIAPEVFSRMYGKASHKSDVYSYGMLVLEMIGARNKERSKNSASNTSSVYFPDWIYKDIEKGECTGFLEEEINRDEEEIVKKMMMVSLWCIQPFPSHRPQMNKVVEMMEGSLETLQVPPRPVLNHPSAPFSESQWPSDGSSSSSDI